MSLGGRTPTKGEREWMDQVRQVGCIVCRLFEGEITPPEIHHLHGKTDPDAHYHTIPLCYFHHRAGLDNHMATSRHPYKSRFEQRYASEQELFRRTQDIVNGGDDGLPI